MNFTEYFNYISNNSNLNTEDAMELATYCWERNITAEDAVELANS